LTHARRPAIDFAVDDPARHVQPRSGFIDAQIFGQVLEWREAVDRHRPSLLMSVPASDFDEPRCRAMASAIASRMKADRLRFARSAAVVKSRMFGGVSRYVQTCLGVRIAYYREFK
jgi:hypothetical protein